MIGTSARYDPEVVNKWKQSIFALRQSVNMCSSWCRDEKGGKCRGSSLPEEGLGLTEKHKLNRVSSSV